MEPPLHEQLEALIRDGKADHAIALIQKTLRHSTTPENVDQLTYYLARSYYTLGLIQESENLLKGISSHLPEKSEIFFNVYYELGRIKLNQDDQEELHVILSTLKQNLDENNLKQLAQYNELLGFYYMKTGDTNRGKLHLNKASQYLAQMNDHEYEAYLYSTLAQILIEQGNILESLTYSSMSLEKYPKKGSKGLFTYILITHARALIYNGMLDTAIETMHQAAQLIYAGLPTSEALALLFLTSIELSLQQGLIKESLVYAQLATPEIQEINQNSLTIQLYYNLILIFIYSLQYEHAQKLFLKNYEFLKTHIPKEKFFYLALYLYKSVLDFHTQESPLGMQIIKTIQIEINNDPPSFLNQESVPRLFHALENIFTGQSNEDSLQLLEQICVTSFPIHNLFIKPLLLLLLIESYLQHYLKTKDPLILQKVRSYLVQIDELVVITGQFIFRYYKDTLESIISSLEGKQTPDFQEPLPIENQLLSLQLLKQKFVQNNYSHP